MLDVGEAREGEKSGVCREKEPERIRRYSFYL
jgi:hypothetical protein